MADLDWEDVEALYDAARARPADERDAFLEEACDDPAVRREVASLLEAREEATGFFGDLAESVRGSAPSSSASADSDRPPPDPLGLENTQVGRYDVETHLGSGGMGVVYRAHDPELDRPVVLKFLPPHLSTHSEAERRFAREAKAASVLEHANIATIYEIGRAETGPAEGRRFIAMAYYEGETLREKLRREGPLPIEAALRYAEQIAEALARAHEAGIVHRDVKPANVMVTETGEVKLLDFGLAKAVAETRLTDPDQQMGTAAYMSPEQAEGNEVDARTDLWALGALLYEMLAGTRPFQGERSSAVVHAILHDEPMPLAEQREAVSPTLERVVHRCLQKERETRYSSATGLLKDLRRLRADVDSADGRQVVGQDEASGGGALSWLWGIVRELRRRRVLRAAAVYAGTGFVIVQLGEILMAPLGVPSSTLRMVTFLLVLGFPLAVGLAWTFDVTEEGLVRTRPRAPAVKGAAGGGKPFTSNGLIVALLIASIGLFLYPRVFSSEDEPASAGGAAAPPTGTAEAPDRSVAVLPFEVSGAGAETWRDGMVTALSLNLDGAAGLRTIADRTVFATLEERGLAQEGLDTRKALEVARGIGARYAIVGSALQMGGDLRLSTEIRRTASGERLGTVHVSGSPDSAMVLANGLTRKILGVLLEKSEERIPSVNLASMTTSSLPALKAYLRGERHFRAGEYEAALQDFEAAAEADSSFALAYARMASSRDMVAGTLGAGAQHWERAYKASDHLPRRERGIVHAWHLRFNQNHSVAAADTLRQLSERYPDDPSVWHSLGEMLWHSSIPRGLPEADRAFQRALDLDPGVAIYHIHPMDLAFSLHRDSALAAQRIAAAPATPEKPLFRLAKNLVFGSSRQRREALARLDTIPFRSEAGSMWPVVNSLQHPTDWPLAEEVFRRLEKRTNLEGASHDVGLSLSSFYQGQPEKALSQMNERSLGSSPNLSCLLAGEISLGTPVPDSTLRTNLQPSKLEEDSSIRRLQCGGIYLVEEDRGEELPALIQRIRKAGNRQDMSDGQVQARIDEIKGYRALRDGNLQRAEKLLRGHNESWHWGAIWRGNLYRKLGELKQAEGWYLGAWRHPVAHERLGQLYEEMGTPEKAQAAYERFVEAWKNADPALQDRVEKARGRLEALR